MTLPLGIHSLQKIILVRLTSFAVKGFWALWYNIIETAMVMLKEAFSLLYATLWKQCIKTKDCLLTAWYL
jgi:hypothetical protein